LPWLPSNTLRGSVRVSCYENKKLAVCYTDSADYAETINQGIG
jgi:hypothetical protein